MKNKSWLFIIMIAILASCSPAVNTHESKKEELYSIWWRLKTVNGFAFPTGEKIPTPYLEFNHSNVSGNMLCNIINGTYTTDAPNKMSISAIATTRKACIDSTFEIFDRQYQNQLARINRWKLEAKTLYLYENNDLKFTYYPEYK